MLGNVPQGTQPVHAISWEEVRPGLAAHAPNSGTELAWLVSPLCVPHQLPGCLSQTPDPKLQLSIAPSVHSPAPLYYSIPVLLWVEGGVCSPLAYL